MTDKELLELALGNQRLAQETQKIVATLQIKMAEWNVALIEVVANQSTRLDRSEIQR